VTLGDGDLGGRVRVDVLASGGCPTFVLPCCGRRSGRVCEVSGFGAVDEQIIEYAPNLRAFACTAEAEKLPGFVKELKNRWTITPAAGERLLVTLKLTADITGPLGAVMKVLDQTNPAPMRGECTCRRELSSDRAIGDLSSDYSRMPAGEMNTLGA